MEVEMKIRGLMMDPVTNMPIMVLKDAQGTAVLPIWVGIYEANAIALEIESDHAPHDRMTFCATCFLGLDVRVQVVVNDLKDDTFYALISISATAKHHRFAPEATPWPWPCAPIAPFSWKTKS